MRRRLIAVAAVAVLVIAGAFAWANLHPAGDPGSDAQRSWLDRLAAAIGLGGGDAAATFSGYVEADYVMVTSSIGGAGFVHFDATRTPESRPMRRRPSAAKRRDELVPAES